MGQQVGQGGLCKAVTVQGRECSRPTALVIKGRSKKPLPFGSRGDKATRQLAGPLRTPATSKVI